jgi:hypothetical protein
MTVSQHDAIDFGMMYVTHAALRRDVGRLAAASAAGEAGTAQVRAGWENFKTQLNIHHGVEDDDLWPRLYRAVADRPGELALLKEMQDEHAILDPLLAAVDEVLPGSAATRLDECLQELAAALDKHLKHEEDSALPLIQSVLTPKDWRGFAAAMRRRQGYKGAAIYVPWLVDGAPPVDRKRILAAFPPPVRLISRLVWEPRYRQLKLWAL